jgi:hypothetical protein
VSVRTRRAPRTTAKRATAIVFVMLAPVNAGFAPEGVDGRVLETPPTDTTSEPVLGASLELPL